METSFHITVYKQIIYRISNKYSNNIYACRVKLIYSSTFPCIFPNLVVSLSSALSSKGKVNPARCTAWGSDDTCVRGLLMGLRDLCLSQRKSSPQSGENRKAGKRWVLRWVGGYQSTLPARSLCAWAGNTPRGSTKKAREGNNWSHIIYYVQIQHWFAKVEIKMQIQRCKTCCFDLPYVDRP